MTDLPFQATTEELGGALQLEEDDVRAALVILVLGSVNSGGGGVERVQHVSQTSLPTAADHHQQMINCSLTL